MDQNQNSFSNYSSTPPLSPNLENQNPNTTAQTVRSRHIGPIVAVLVVLLIIIVFSIYFVSKQFDITNPDSNTSTSVSTEDTNIDLNSQFEQNSASVSSTIAPISNTKDDLESLQMDLNTSIDGIDAQQI